MTVPLKNFRAFEPSVWLEHINAINHTKTLQELSAYFAEPMGFTMAIAMNIPPIGSKDRQNSSRFFYYNAPKELLSHIRENYFYKLDPVAQYVLDLGRPIWLSDLLSEPLFTETGYDKTMKLVMNIMGDGMCCPSFNQNYWGYSFMSFGRPKEEFDEVLLWQVQTLCQVFHQHYVFLMRRLQKKINLTNRELDVIELVAGGKTNAEIAVILDITANTVAGYVKSIYLKLNTNDRVSATLRAMSLNLIS